MKTITIITLLFVACTSATTTPHDDGHVHTAAPAQTATPLQSDEFDAPAATSVAEADKARGPEVQHGLYVCPMHPEVTSDKPGKCPKCGMTLVKKD